MEVKVSPSHSFRSLDTDRDGTAFAGSVWLNDVYLGPTFGNSTNNLNIIATTNQTYEFPAGSLKEGNNIVTVLVDNMGQDEGDVQVKHPRGIQGYALLGPKETDFTSWKVQGKEGGNSAYAPLVLLVPRSRLMRFE